MWFDETHVPVWKAGEIAPAGVYVRIENRSYQQVRLAQQDPCLPPLMARLRSLALHQCGAFLGRRATPAVREQWRRSSGPFSSVTDDAEAYPAR